MPQAKKPENKRSLSQVGRPSVATAAGEVLSLSETAAYLRVGEADVLRQIDEQALPARRIGNEWRLLKSAIQTWLGREATVDTSKAAQFAVIGAWKDDPFMEGELREIEARRREE